MPKGLSTFGALKHLRTDDAVTLDEAELCRLQRVLTGVLKDILEACAQKGVTCLLAGGTALGARRDGRFIPWDDDVDLLMPRADYRRFVEIFETTLGGFYVLQAPRRSRRHTLASVRVRLKGTSVVTREDVASGETDCGAFVDIFIVENTFDCGLLRKVHGFGSLALGFLYSCRKFFAERRLLRAYTAEASFRRVYRFKTALGLLTAWLPLRVWVSLWDWWNALCRNDRSRFVTIPVGRAHFFGELGLREELCVGRAATFEGLPSMVPAGVDAYLTRLYGPDFLTPPSASAREEHVFYKPFYLDDKERTP